MFTNEDKCIGCGKDLTFYGLTYRFKGGRCYNCRQSYVASQCNKDGKISESLKGNSRGGFNLPHSIERRNATKEELRKDPEYWNRTVGALIRGGKTSKIKGWYFSKKTGRIYYQSSWELRAFAHLDNDENVRTFKINPFRIPYSLEGVEKHYIPDILVEYIDDSRELIEIKPKRKLLDLTVKLKLLEATKWSLDNKIPFSVWTEETWPYRER